MRTDKSIETNSRNKIIIINIFKFLNKILRYYLHSF